MLESTERCVVGCVVSLLVVAGVAAGCGPSDKSSGGDCADPPVLVQEDLAGGTTLEAGCYRVDDTLEVQSGRVVLEPGVTIEFAEDAGLNFADDGRLTAEGTAEDSIVLTGVEQERGYWRGIQFSESDSGDNSLNHVTLEYAGSTDWGGSLSQAGLLADETSSVSIANSTFRENAPVAVMKRRASADFEVSETTFRSNAAPIAVNPGDVGGIGAGNTFEDNETNQVIVGTRYFDDSRDGSRRKVNRESTWRNHGVPYRFAEGAEPRAAVTIEPGTTLIFEQGHGIQVDEGGRLTADAGDGESITFTGVEENNGFWKGLAYYTLSSDNILNNVVVEYGGSSSHQSGDKSKANVFLRGSRGPESTVAIDGSTIRGSGNHGIRIQEDSELSSCSNVTFEDNEGYDVSLDDGNDEEAVGSVCN